MKRVLENKDFWAGLFFIFLGFAAVLTAGENEMGTLSRMGPAYFPTAVGILLCLLGMLVALRALVFDSHTSDGPALQWGVIVFVLGSVALFAVTLLTAGLIAAVMMLVLVSSVASASTRPFEALLLSAVLAMAAWGIFIVGLGLRIPIWPAFL